MHVLLLQIVYQLSNDEGKFRISSSGVITLTNSLDREIAGEYNLTVTAIDRGQPQMSSTGYLLVSVADENDVVPAFLSVCNRIAALAQVDMYSMLKKATVQ